jgi:ferric-dicitrate binding protein FerR (iron transport regulator)
VSHDLLDSLTQDFLDGCSQPASLAELSALIASDPSAAEAFVRTAKLDTLLEEHFVERQAEAQFTLPPVVRPALPPIGTRMSGRSASHAVRAIAMVLIIGVGLLWLRRSVDQEASPDAPTQVVAGRVLVDGVERATIPDESPIEVTGLGAATIRLRNGTEVELAPETMATFRTNANDPIVALDRGGGRFRIESAGPYLQVETLAGVVRGRGTEFAVKVQQEVSQSGEPAARGGDERMKPSMLALLTVAVLAGEVDVSGAEEGGAKQKTKVAEGETRIFTSEKKPSFAGRVVRISEDGRRLTLERKPPKPGASPEQREVQLTDRTHLAYYGVGKTGVQPRVGYTAMAWLDREAPEQALSIEFGSKEPQLSGQVVTVSKDGQSFTLDIYRKHDTPLRQSVTLSDRTRLSYQVESGDKRPTPGYRADVWLEGETDAAIDIRFIFKPKRSAAEKTPAESASKTPESPAKPRKPIKTTDNPAPSKSPPEKGNTPPKLESPKKPDSASPTVEKPKSPADKPRHKDEKPESAPAKPKKGFDSSRNEKPAKTAPPRRESFRDAGPVAAAIDREIGPQLADAGIPVSPHADDAEFLRRVSLDVTGRIPNVQRAAAFLESTSPDKRRRLIEELLASREFGLHFGRRWRTLIEPRDLTSTKQGTDRLTPWLAEQFESNRPWNGVVTDLLTATGDLARDPEASFFRANSESLEPKPSLLAASASRLFLGIQVGCAECHNHPFAAWTQDDFWGIAAFFGRVHKQSKRDFTLTEELDAGAAADAVIRLPAGAGKAAGRTVAARWIDGGGPAVETDRALRPQLAAWMTSRENPYFARAFVNRLWAQFFGRGLVEPVDDLRPENPPTHPELLALLAKEFAESDFNVQHVVRCLCLSDAYQRTSRPLDGNESDATLLSHMAVKVMTPGVLRDSLEEALNADPLFRDEPGRKKGGRRGRIDLGTEEAWIRRFGRAPESERGDRFVYGVPELLRLMNAAEFNAQPPMIAELIASGHDADQMIETLYLAALSRHPDEAERERMRRLVREAGTPEDGYADVFWVLIHGSEFLLNR